MVRTIEFYKRENRSPVDEFLDDLNDKQAAKVLWTMKAIRELPYISGSYLKKLVNTDDIWEIRVIYGGNIFRLLGFFAKRDQLIIVHAFAKKTQQTPRQEIVLAEQRKREYESRSSNG